MNLNLIHNFVSDSKGHISIAVDKHLVCRANSARGSVHGRASVFDVEVEMRRRARGYEEVHTIREKSRLLLLVKQEHEQ